jgi:hypothetical protein
MMQFIGVVSTVSHPAAGGTLSASDLLLSVLMKSQYTWSLPEGAPEGVSSGIVFAVRDLVKMENVCSSMMCSTANHRG